jgi:hypothetical protein
MRTEGAIAHLQHIDRLTDGVASIGDVDPQLASKW